MPATNLIIVLFGAPLAVFRRRRAPGRHGYRHAGLYRFMGSFYLTRSMGYSGMIPPLAAAWTPIWRSGRPAWGFIFKSANKDKAFDQSGLNINR